MKTIAVLVLISTVPTTCAFAQKNELSLSLGAMTASDQNATVQLGIACPITNPDCNQFSNSTSAGFAIEGAFTRQLIGFGPASLDLELPLVGVPGRDVTVTTALTGGVPITASQSSFFFTPSARIKLLHSSPISPFFSVGGGLAHQGTSAAFSGTQSSSDRNNWALQFGGGLDFKTPLPHLAVRAQVRDFYIRGPLESSTLVHVSPTHVHNIFAGGGLVLRF